MFDILIKKEKGQIFIWLFMQLYILQGDSWYSWKSKSINPVKKQASAQEYIEI